MGQVWPYMTTRTDYISPRRWKNQLKHWYYRARYGVAPADTWSFDYSMVQIYLKVLPEFLNDKPTNVYHISGMNLLPHDNVALFRSEFDDGNSLPEDFEEQAMQRWDENLQSIIDAFQEFVDLDTEFVSLEEEKRRKDEMVEAMHKLADIFPMLWW